MASTISYADVQVGEELKSWSYKVERINLVMYAGASGDFNPIHWNPGFAKMVGLPDTIATGMHTMARIGQFVTDWAGDPGAVVRFQNRFTQPVVVPDEGTTVEVTGTITEKLDNNVVRVALEATSNGVGVSSAVADVRLA